MKTRGKLVFSLALLLFFVIGFAAGYAMDKSDKQDKQVNPAKAEPVFVRDVPKFPPIDPTGYSGHTSYMDAVGEIGVREVVEGEDNHYIVLETVNGKAMMPLVDGYPLFFNLPASANPYERELKEIEKQRKFWYDQINGYLEKKLQRLPPKKDVRVEGMTEAEKDEIYAKTLKRYENNKKHYEAQMEFLKSMENYETKVGT